MTAVVGTYHAGEDLYPLPQTAEHVSLAAGMHGPSKKVLSAEGPVDVVHARPHYP